MQDDSTRMPRSAPSDDATRQLPPSTDGDEPESVAPTLALPLGTRLHEFEITGVLGEGGFGIVYLARDHSLEREVALKEYMPAALAARGRGLTVSVRSNRHVETFQAGLRSFVNEGKLLARFDHPSLVKVYRFWEANGTAYMAMPYYRGTTLKNRVKDDAVPPSEAWLRTLLASLLDAIDVLHQENCFHRDIAPDNILLVEDDRPVLLDFGAARRVIGDMTQGLTVILKPGYAPIEQYAEVPEMRQGAWTDLYALGATIYFAIVGRAPNPAVERMISDKLKPLATLANGRYSDGFLSAIDAVLRVKPDDRPQDVKAFAALLARTAQPGPPGAQAKAPRSDVPPSNDDVHRDSQTQVRPTASHWPKLAAIAATLVLSAGGYWAYRGTGGDGTRPVVPPIAESAQPPVDRGGPSVPPAPATPATSRIGQSGPNAGVPAPTSAQPADATKSVPDVPPTTATAAVPPLSQPLPASRPKPAPVVAAIKPPSPFPIAKPPAAVDLPGVATPPSGQLPTVPRERDDSEIASILGQANQSLSKSDFRRAIALADRVLAIEPANARAVEIRRAARAGESKAFDNIKIE